MSAFTIEIIDAQFPWDLTPKERLERKEVIAAEATDLDEAIEEAESWAGECDWEWAKVILKRGSRKVWENYSN